MRQLLSAATANTAHSAPKDCCNDGNTDQDQDRDWDRAERDADEISTAEGPRDDWKSKVHALNVLRVVFVDATLADDVGPYVTEVGSPRARDLRVLLW